MRIALVTESFLPAVNGVTNSIIRLLEHVSNRGHDALLIAPGDGPGHHLGIPVRRVPGVKIPRYRSIQLGIPSREIRSDIEAFMPDVVYVAAPIGVGAYALRVCRRLGIPTVACYQTDIAGFLKNYGLGKLDRPVWKWLSHVHNLANRTLAPSNSSLTDLSAHGVENVHLWRRGVDGNLFTPGRRDEQLRATWNLQGKLAVGYIGRLAHEKRVGDLAALADDNRLKLVIVGEGPQRSRLVRELPGAIFPGFREGQDLARHFASLDLFVHTGQHETFCQTIQEALSSGVPVVAPAQGGPIDLVQPAKNGLLFDPQDPTHLRRCVEMLISDDEFRLRLAENARNSVEERSWRMIGEQWEQHLYEVCAGARRAS